MKKRTLPNILTQDEEIRLLSQFNPRYPTSHRNRTMLLLALNTGMRIGDLVSLRWQDIEMDTGRCHLKNGKGAKDRVIFIRPAVLSEMVEMSRKMNREPMGLVFTTLKGESVKTPYLRRMIAEKARKAGIKKRVHFHLLRHTYLTRLYQRTKDIRVVQEIAGHADISTTQIYTRISGEDVRDAMLNTS